MIHNRLKFKIEDGRELTLIPSSHVFYECSSCKFYCFTDANRGVLTCPACRTPTLKGQWVTLQVVAVPESPEDFKPLKGE